jgi:hypothetical protein
MSTESPSMFDCPSGVKITADGMRSFGVMLCIQREKRLLIIFPPVAGFITLSNRRMRLIREVLKCDTSMPPANGIASHERRPVASRNQEEE